MRGFSIGLKALLLGGCEYTRNLQLQRRYGFNGWHVRSPFHWKPYKQIVVDTANSLDPKTAVEIGCGLGDIISRVHASKVLGLDRDERVVEASRRLYATNFRVCGDLLQAGAVIGSEGLSSVGALIMVNWPHGIPSTELISSVRSISQHVPIEFLIIDLIKPEMPTYKFHHSVESLSQLGTLEHLLPSIDNVRDLAVFRLEM